ncbi:MAG TPA: nucleotidyltransferase domain-containing protein [Pyrinomonadaceae bacterium]|nr:nucleotidyltransferase domain-containing protein [Pyrinomonadaceae bacterium]
MLHTIRINKEQLADFCRRNHIAKLSFFGSVLGDDFTAESDIDVLIDFESGHTPGLLRMARLERELSALLHNRKVDIRTAQDLSRYFREQVLATAQVQYAQG